MNLTSQARPIMKPTVRTSRKLNKKQEADVRVSRGFKELN